jgi:YVTN family beta-propeller protein
MVLCLAVALIGAVGCGGGSGGSDNSKGNDTDLIVQQVLPTNNQEVESNLIDVDGFITVRFSAPVAQGTVLDDGNAYNGLTSNLNILDSAFQRVPGDPEINYETGRGNVLTFVPSGGVLPNGQYTVTAMRDIRSTSGKMLNNGRWDHRSSFTVGTDTYKPVIRSTYPAAAQKEIPKDSQIIVIFNESLDPDTVTDTTFSVNVSGAGNPKVSGTIALSRDNFEIIFTPDPDSLMPPNSTIVVTVTGGASGISDVVGNTFEDPVTNQPTWQFQFETVTEPPPPNNPAPTRGVYYSNSSGVGTLDESGYLNSFPDLSGWSLTGGTDPSTGNPVSNPVPNSFVRTGRPGEMMVDLTGNGTTGNFWIYTIDTATNSVTLINSVDSTVAGRWKQLPDPRGLAYNTTGVKSLYVTNFSNDSVSVLDIARLSRGAMKLDKNSLAIADGDQRQDIPVGRGPVGAAHTIGPNDLFVANALDNSVTRLDTSTNQILTTFNVGTSPYDVAATFVYQGVGYFAFITCQGGGVDEDGSVAVWWDVPNGLQATVTGFKNPQGIIFDYGTNFWVADSGGDTTSRLTLQFAGGSFAATIFPTITTTVQTGANPTDVTMEPFFFWVQGAAPQAVITANRGAGKVSFIDAVQPSRPIFRIDVPGVRGIASLMDQ